MCIFAYKYRTSWTNTHLESKSSTLRWLSSSRADINSHRNNLANHFLVTESATRKCATWGIFAKKYVHMKKILSIILLLAGLTLFTSMVSADRECSRCSGRGTIPDNCSFCGGRGWRDCSLCNGNKSIRCTVCGGAGEYVCPQCRGRNENCRTCGGDGIIGCDRCSGTGSINCTSCRGSGHYPCSQCNQTGIKNWTCPDCRGTGRVDD